MFEIIKQNCVKKLGLDKAYLIPIALFVKIGLHFNRKYSFSQKRLCINLICKYKIVLYLLSGVQVGRRIYATEQI